MRRIHLQYDNIQTDYDKCLEHYINIYNKLWTFFVTTTDMFDAK